MAWSINLNDDGRQRLAGVLRGLLIVQLIISIIMAIFCYNSSVKVLMLLQQIHKITVFLLYGLVLLQAYSLKLHYTSGFRLLTWLLHYPLWPRAGAVSKMWLISGTLIAANGLIVHAACKNIVKMLMDELSYSLRIGIAQYLSEPAWKILLDTMQVELNCCGADEPSDWHEIPWLNVDFLNQDSKLVMKLAGVDGKLLPPVSPYSCCSPYVITACYHDPFQQYIDGREWSRTLATASMSALGCARAASTPLSRAITAMHLLSLLMLMLQIVITTLTLVLRESCARAPQRSGQDSQVRSGTSAYRGTVAQRRSMRRVRSRGYACLS